MAKRKTKEIWTRDKRWFRDNPGLGLIVMALPAYKVGTPVEVDADGKVLSFKSEIVGYQTWKVVAETGEVLKRASTDHEIHTTADAAMSAYWSDVGVEIRNALLLDEPIRATQLGDEPAGILGLPDYGDGSGDAVPEGAVSEAYTPEPAD